MIFGDSYTLYDTGLSLIFPWRISPHDASRMPLYGFFWNIASLFLSRAQAAMWINLIALSGSMALWHVTLLALSKSHTRSIFLSLFSLIAVTFSMRQFYLSSMALDDALFCYMSVSGSLLVFLGYLQHSYKISYAGIAMLGLAVFMKPVGIILLPVWGTFIVWQSFKYKTLKRRVSNLVLCTLLLIGPISLWSVRQYIVYGHLRSNAFGAVHLLTTVLPFVEDNDVLIKDPIRNSTFLATLRKHEELHGKYRGNYLWKDKADAKLYNPIVQLQLQNNLFVNPNKYTKQYVQNQFVLGEIAMPIALRIIWLHWQEYVSVVLKNFWYFFELGAQAMQEESLQETYKVYVRQTDKLPMYYPPDGKVHISVSNETAQHFLLQYCCKNSFRSMLLQINKVLPFVAIFIFFWHGILLIPTAQCTMLAATQYRTPWLYTYCANMFVLFPYQRRCLSGRSIRSCG